MAARFSRSVVASIRCACLWEVRGGDNVQHRDEAVARRRAPRLAIAAIALATLGLGLSLGAAVGGERAADVVALLELSRCFAADVALVGAGVNQGALRRGAAFGRAPTLRGAVLPG